MPFVEGTPTVEIAMGGKSLTLGWTWGAKLRLSEYLKAHGADLESPDVAVGQNLPAVVWAALDAETRKEISVEEIAEMVNPRNELRVIAKIGELFTASEPEREPEGNARAGAVETPTPAPWTSKESAPLLSTT